MLASAPAEHYARTLEIVLRDASVDSVIAIFIPPLVTDAESVADGHSAPRRIRTESQSGGHDALRGGSASLSPFLATPSLNRQQSRWPARRLCRMATQTRECSRIRRHPSGTVRRPIDAALHRGGGWLTRRGSNALLTAAGIEHAPTRRAATHDDAVRVAAEIGFPVALKAMGPTLLHKTERRP